MSTPPLDASTPSELFGADAVTDARTLKRAYARLVREHRPEVAPEAFQHIRRLYEQAQEALRQGVGVTHVVVDDTVQDTATVLAGIEASAASWRAAIQALARRARTGDLTALQAGFAVLAAVAPDESFDFLGEHVSVPGAEAHILGMLEVFFAAMPGRTRDPALDRLIDRLSPNAALRLRLRRVLALAPFHPARAAAFFRRDQALLLAEPEAILALLFRAMGDLRWELSVDELRLVLEAADDARLPLEDGSYRFVQLNLHAPMAVRTMTAPELAPVADALRLGHRNSNGQRALALLDLRRSTQELPALLDRLEEEHPGVAAAVLDTLELTTDTHGQLLAWAVAGEAPTPAGVTTERWLTDLQALFDAHLTDAAPDPKLRVRLPLLIVCVTLLLMSLCVFAAGFAVLWGVLGEWGWTPTGGVCLLAGGVLFAASIAAFNHMAQEMKRERMQAVEAWLEGEERRYESVVDAVLSEAAELGYWPVEVAGAWSRLRSDRVPTGIGEAIGDPARTLALVRNAHVHRAVRLEIQERDTSAADSGDDA